MSTNPELNSHQLQTETTPRERLLVRTFLNRARDLYPIDSIYYPSCGNDTLLTGALTDTSIYYLDKRVKRPDGISFVEDYMTPPFEPESFDAIILKDVHIKESGYSNQEHRKRLAQLLKPVKKDGLIICANFGCPIWEIDVPFIKQSPLTRPTNIPFTPRELEVFLKN